MFHFPPAIGLRSHLLFPWVASPKFLRDQGLQAPRSSLGAEPWLLTASAVTPADVSCSLGS